jgi:hypothetical protein
MFEVNSVVSARRSASARTPTRLSSAGGSWIMRVIIHGKHVIVGLFCCQDKQGRLWPRVIRTIEMLPGRRP